MDSKLEAVNVFLGFYNAPDSSGETLFSCIKDVFVCLNLPLERLKGFGDPNALYVHCSNHSLDLVLQEVASEVSVVADTLNFVRGVSVMISELSKRKTLFKSMFGDDKVVCNLLSLCPTRWVIRTRAISRVCSSYTALLETLKMLEQDKTVRGDTRAKIAGLQTSHKSQDIHYRSKVWGHLEISLFFKEKHFFFNEDNIKLIRNTLYIVNVVNDYSRWKRLVFNEIST